MPGKRETIKAAPPAKGGKPGRRPAEVEFPRDSLSEALKIADSIERNNAGKPYDLLDLAASLGLAPSGPVYRRLITSSSRYGLTEGGYKAEKIKLTPLGSSIVAPTEEGESSRGIREAVLRPALFRKVLEFYDGKRIPAIDILKNALRHQFNVPPEDEDTCHDVIMKNLRDYGAIQSIKGNDYLQLDKIGPAAAPPPEEISETVSELKELEGGEKTEEVAPPPSKSRQIFVAHGKNRKPLDQLKTILTQFKVPFVVAVDEPHKGRPISAKVAQLMHDCGSGIFIFTADEETKDGQGNTVWRPSDNVVFELGAGVSVYGDKIVILREEGVSFGSDFTDFGHITFERDRLDAKAFDLMKELIGLGFLQVTPT